MKASFFRLFFALFLSLCLTSGLSAQNREAKKHALLIGGSGESLNQRNLFEDDFRVFSSRLLNRGWEVEVLFGNGKIEIERAKSATNENILSALKSTARQTGLGDQVLLFLHSHGQKRRTKNDEGFFEIEMDPETQKPRLKLAEKSHGLVTEQPDGFSLDRLEPFLKSFNQKGASTALVDLSCFSGATQNLAAKNLCIVSLAASSYVSNCGGFENSHVFTKHFIDLPKDPKVAVDIESQYLMARLKDDGPVNLASISSIPYSAHDYWEQLLVASDPASYERRDAFDGSPETADSPYSEATTKDSLLMMAIALKDREMLAQLLDPDFKILDHPDASFYPRDQILRRLDTLVKEVNEDHQQALKDVIEKLDHALTTYVRTEQELNSVVEKVRKLQEGLFELDLEPNEFLTESQVASLNERGNLSLLESLIKVVQSPVSLDEISGYSDRQKRFFSGLRAQKENLTEAYERILERSGIEWKNYLSLEQRLEREAKQVMQLERAFYDRYARATLKAEPNPCRDFKL